MTGEQSIDVFEALLSEQPLSVRRAACARLERYEAFLHKWQKKINLVGPESLKDVRRRHFADSAQILRQIPEIRQETILFDFGSGAGFPGLVLALLRPDLKVHLVESDQKKCSFLRTVSRETQAQNVTLHCCRIESLPKQDSLPPPDYITARALAPLDRLLCYAQPFSEANPALTFLFLKGGRAQEEIREAQKHYQFDLEEIPSLSDSSGRLLKITNLRRLLKVDG